MRTLEEFLSKRLRLWVNRARWIAHGQRKFLGYKR